MDTRLVVTILFVAAVAVNTATAQDTTTATPTTVTPTTAAPTTVTPTTAAPTTVTPTTAAPTTVTPTTAAPTTAASTTAAPTTAASTTAAPTTTAPPLTPNTTVDVLTINISRTDCGTGKLCLAQPTSCDPSSDGSCYFASAKQQSGQNFNFELSGNSTGYIALTVSFDSTVGNNDTTYVCANNNGTVQFNSTSLNNNILSSTNLSVNTVKGKVNGSKIQCTFAATVQSVTTKATTNITVAVLTGSFNSTSGALGSPVQQFNSTVADLSNANSSVTYSISSTNTNTNTAITFQQSLTQALLIAVGVLRLAML